MFPESYLSACKSMSTSTNSLRRLIPKLLDSPDDQPKDGIVAAIVVHVDTNHFPQMGKHERVVEVVGLRDHLFDRLRVFVPVAKLHHHELQLVQEVA